MAEQKIKKFSLKEIHFGSILTDLINIDTITDIELRYGEVWIVDIKKGRYQYDLATRSKDDVDELMLLLDSMPRQISIRMEVNYNEGSPILDGEAMYHEKGQLRINAIFNSITEGGYPGIAIRKTTYGLRITDETITADSFATDDFLNLMEVLLSSGCNVMISGLTGSGKTELLKYIARYIRDNEAIITIEDTFEAYLKRIYPKKEVLALKATENEGFSELIRACLRQNPDWIMVSETRGEEVKELMAAAGTGHHLISTIHADSAANIPWRMVDMAKVDGAEATRMLRQIHQNINIGIYIHYYNDATGSHRQITEVCEFYLEGSSFPQSHSIYEYDYETESYKSDTIKSPVILNKIRRGKVDISKIAEKFISTNERYIDDQIY